MATSIHGVQASLADAYLSSSSLKTSTFRDGALDPLPAELGDDGRAGKVGPHTMLLRDGLELCARKRGESVLF